VGRGYSNTTVDHQSRLSGDDPLIGEEIVRLTRPNTRVVYLESAGSPTFEVQDVPAIATAAHEVGAKVLTGNTWTSPPVPILRPTHLRQTRPQKRRLPRLRPQAGCL